MQNHHIQNVDYTLLLAVRSQDLAYILILRKYDHHYYQHNLLHHHTVAGQVLVSEMLLE